MESGGQNIDHAYAPDGYVSAARRRREFCAAVVHAATALLPHERGRAGA
jgi:hypothetical protein